MGNDSVEIRETGFQGSDIARQVVVGDKWAVYMKWDGCCEIEDLNEGKSDGSKLHICDVPVFVKQLQAIESYRLANIEGAE